MERVKAISGAELVRQKLKNCGDSKKAAHLAKFFQAFPGGYGEGDRFLGVAVPVQRRIAKSWYRDIALCELENLLRDPLHECRLTAIFIMVYKFEKAKTASQREALISLYLGNLIYVNNWDLVDSSAYKLLGPYLADKDRSLLYSLAGSGVLWQERIAVIATLHFIRHHDYADTLKLAKMLIGHRHDLIHKAVGWMLRETGNRDFKVEYDFLQENYRIMPRTMLRYAIEKFEPDLRKRFLAGQV